MKPESHASARSSGPPSHAPSPLRGSLLLRGAVLLWACVAVVGSAAVAEKVPVVFNLPDGLGDYTGKQPVTFGVPFARGVLKVGDGVRLVDGQGKALPAQFEVTSAWLPEKAHVRWLLVDAFADVRGGKVAPAFLEFGPGVRPAEAATRLKVSAEKDVAVVDTGRGKWRFARDGGDLGLFRLKTDFQNVFTAGLGNGDYRIEVEKTGPVRVVVKVSGSYGKTSGLWPPDTVPGTPPAEFVTRVRLYSDCPFVRVYHTMTWMTDDRTRIAELAWEPAGAKELGEVSVGLDGKAVKVTGAEPLVARQAEWNRVKGSVSGTHLDGWVQAVGPAGSWFAALRWPWQQFPVAVFAGGGPRVGLLAPETPLSLAVEDSVFPPLKKNLKKSEFAIYRGGVPMQDCAWNGEEAIPHISPRGISRTWELLVWSERDGAGPDPATKNLLCQHPVLACADPAFATRAALPSPASPRNPKEFPEVESAIERAFDWYTREKAEDGDFGVWNYGEVQWGWTAIGFPIYRYWMGNGKGWSVLPWALWIRSGDRRYWENGEVQSRHKMDLGICQTRDAEWNPLDGKLRGGQYCFSILHWGRGPTLFEVFNDTEWLPTCYFMTGFERARDVLQLMAEAVANYKYRDEYLKFIAADVKGRSSRHVYQSVKNVGALYEATGDERLRSFAEEWLKLTLASQTPEGDFYGVKSNNYLDESLLLAARVFGWDRVGSALQRWQAFRGDALRPGATGEVLGPCSLRTSLALHERSGDPHLLEVAAKVMNAQASCVMDGEGEWRGLNGISAMDAGPALRDWVATMAALSALPREKRPTGYIPMAGFHSHLPLAEAEQKEGWGGFHFVATLKERAEPVKLTIAFPGLRPPWRMRVIAPDGKAVARVEGDASKESALRTRSCTLPGDLPSGVYGIEIWTKNPPQLMPPIHVASSTGKLVHHLAPGQRTAFSPHLAGQFWFRPEGPGKEILFNHYQGSFLVARDQVLDPRGAPVASNRVEKTIPPTVVTDTAYASGIPSGPACRFTPSSVEEGLYSFVVNSEANWHHAHEVRGLRPWVSATREEWFDPEKHPHAPFPSAVP